MCHASQGGKWEVLRKVLRGSSQKFPSCDKWLRSLFSFLVYDFGKIFSGTKSSTWIELEQNRKFFFGRKA